MRLTKSTIQILSNFASINSNIVIDQGNTIRTISEAKNILAKATVEETFDSEFGVYDLNEFLGVLKLVDNPNLNFQDDFVIISDESGLTNIKYFFSDTEMLTKAGKDVRMPEGDVKLDLSEDILQKLRSAAGALGHSEMLIQGIDNGLAKVTVTTSDNSTANTFSIEIPATSDVHTYKFVYNINNLKMLSGDYEVEISSKLISKLTNKLNGLQYWIALEKSSTYGE
tara:strand:- start:4814 stop:5491 length:678 start_codon:yes stop_codon:yes gene_type:complete